MVFARLFFSPHLSKLVNNNIKVQKFHRINFAWHFDIYSELVCQRKHKIKHKQDAVCDVMDDCGSLISSPQATECNPIFATSLKTPTEDLRVASSCLILSSYSSQIYMIMAVSLSPLIQFFRSQNNRKVIWSKSTYCLKIGPIKNMRKFVKFRFIRSLWYQIVVLPKKPQGNLW